jgi:ABC-type Fe3+ transport system substrate-binding protein
MPWKTVKTNLKLSGSVSSLLQARSPLMPARGFYCGIRDNARTKITMSLHSMAETIRNLSLPRKISAKRIFGFNLVLSLLLIASGSSSGADTLDQLTAAAKNESELYFVAGPSTFGGKKGLADLEAAFNKNFGLGMRLHFSAGPEMNAMAARVITELKAGGKASTDMYLGSLGQFARLVKENALEEVEWSKTFSWITPEMEEIPSRRGVLVYTSPRGIIYNTNLVSEDKAPKKYEDVVDPRLSATWAGKMAIPPYPNWLVELSLLWGEERVKDFTRKLVSLSGGRLRYGEEERVISGEFPLMANIGDSLATMWKWRAKKAPLVAVLGVSPADTSYFHMGVPKNSAHPHLAKLFVAFMASKEAQAILDKHDFRSSHLMEGSRMARYLREHKVALQNPKDLFSFYLKGGGFKLNQELSRLLKQ